MGRREKPTRRGGAPALATARTLWRKQRYDEALRAFHEAVRDAPDDLAVMLEAGRAFGVRYQMGRAATLIERALRLGARRGDVQREAGLVYLKLGRVPEAEACFRRAGRLSVDPVAQLELAKICERRHDLDEADERVAAALHVAPGSLPARLLRARIDRRRGDTSRAYATLRQAIDSANAASAELPELYGELCTLLDGLGQYDAAWDAMLQGKRLQQVNEATAWHAAQFVMRRCTQMYDDLSAEHVTRWAAQADLGESRRVALLTGFPRSGTTLLEQVLDAHPDVVSSEEKEVFGGEILPWLGEGLPPDAPLVGLLDSLPSNRIATARQMYLDAMQAMLGEPIGSRLHLDKNPAMNPMIPAMRRVFPELKLLVALRDPRDVVVSCFLRYLPVNPMSAWFLTLERTVDRYVMDLTGWLRLRDIVGSWTEVRYEALVADLPGQARRTLAALEVPWDDSVLNYRQRDKARPVQSPTYEAVAQPVFSSSIGRWRRYERQLAPLLNRLTPVIRALGYAG